MKNYKGCSDPGSSLGLGGQKRLNKVSRRHNVQHWQSRHLLSRSYADQNHRNINKIQVNKLKNMRKHYCCISCTNIGTSLEDKARNNFCLATQQREKKSPKEKQGINLLKYKLATKTPPLTKNLLHRLCSQFKITKSAPSLFSPRHQLAFSNFFNFPSSKLSIYFLANSEFFVITQTEPRH